MNAFKSFIVCFTFLTVAACAQVKENDIVIKNTTKKYQYKKIVDDIENPWGFIWW